MAKKAKEKQELPEEQIAPEAVEIDNSGEMSSVNWNKVIKNTAMDFVCGVLGGDGATHGNKYMRRQELRLLKHIPEDGFSKAMNFAWKMTANYSKQFVAPIFIDSIAGYFINEAIKVAVGTVWEG